MSRGGFRATGKTVLMSVTASVHTSVQVIGDSNSWGYSVCSDAASSTVCYIAIGSTNAITAAIPEDGTPATGIPINPGETRTFDGPMDAYFSAVCASGGSASLYITPGEGR